MSLKKLGGTGAGQIKYWVSVIKHYYTKFENWTFNLPNIWRTDRIRLPRLEVEIDEASQSLIFLAQKPTINQ